MKIAENSVVTLEYKVYDAETKELLEDTADLGPYFYIQGMGQFLPKVEAALDGKTKGYKTSIEIPMDEAYGPYDEELAEDYVVANAFDKRVPLAVAKAVAETAIKTGVARKTEVPY